MDHGETCKGCERVKEYPPNRYCMYWHNGVYRMSQYLPDYPLTPVWCPKHNREGVVKDLAET